MDNTHISPYFSCLHKAPTFSSDAKAAAALICSAAAMAAPRQELIESLISEKSDVIPITRQIALEIESALTPLESFPAPETPLQVAPLGSGRAHAKDAGGRILFYVRRYAAWVFGEPIAECKIKAHREKFAIFYEFMSNPYNRNLFDAVLTIASDESFVDRISRHAHRAMPIIKDADYAKFVARNLLKQVGDLINLWPTVGPQSRRQCKRWLNSYDFDKCQYVDSESAKRYDNAVMSLVVDDLVRLDFVADNLDAEAYADLLNRAALGHVDFETR